MLAELVEVSRCSVTLDACGRGCWLARGWGAPDFFHARARCSPRPRRPSLARPGPVASSKARSRSHQGEDVETDDEDEAFDGNAVAGKKRKVGEADGDLAGDGHPPAKKRAEAEDDVEE